MDKYTTIKNYNDTRFRNITGVSKAAFYAMLAIIEQAYDKKHQNRGRHSKLTRENMLLMTLEYLTEYRTQERIGASYGLAKSRVSETIGWVEKTLLESGLFSLPGKRKLLEANTDIEIIVVDV